MKNVLIHVVVLRTLIARLVIIEVYVLVFLVTRVTLTESDALLSHLLSMTDAKKIRIVQVKKHA